MPGGRAADLLLIPSTSPSGLNQQPLRYLLQHQLSPSSTNRATFLEDRIVLRTSGTGTGNFPSPNGYFEGVAVAPLGLVDSSQDASAIGGRLQAFSSRWEATVSDGWVIQTITNGLALEFFSIPPDSPPISSNPSNPRLIAPTQEAVSHLLQIRAIEPVSPAEGQVGFYSRLFLVPKSSGEWRAILDLKRLNRNLVYRRFKMHTLGSILDSVRKGDFLASIDLSEAYLHIPIFPRHRRFLRFLFQGVHYQYAALPFGLSSAPRTFTKVLTALLAHLRSIPIRVQSYLDDILVQATSYNQAEEDVNTTVQTLTYHGFLINYPKSHLVPTTRIQHLGVIIDTSLCHVFLSEERTLNIRDHVHQVRHKRSVQVASLSSLLGKFISCILVVPWARLHSRPLQWFLLPYQKRGLGDSTSLVQLPSSVKQSLAWWSSEVVEKGCPLRVRTSLTITTDASLLGWGAHMGPDMVQGQWHASEQSLPINLLELRAIRLALLHFEQSIKGEAILILTDNVAAKAHVNRQGGTRSRALMTEAWQLCLWAEERSIILQAQHISGAQNLQADWLSRSQLDQTEWQLDPGLFLRVASRFGYPVVDLFASAANTQLPRFHSRFFHPRAEATDSLTSPWPAGLLYAFPPISLLPAVIRKIMDERAEVILIAPHWPRRPWFSDLVALSVQRHWHLPLQYLSLRQGEVLHPDPAWFHLTAWRLSGKL